MQVYVKQLKSVSSQDLMQKVTTSSTNAVFGKILKENVAAAEIMIRIVKVFVATKVTSKEIQVTHAPGMQYGRKVAVIAIRYYMVCLFYVVDNLNLFDYRTYFTN